MRSSQNLSTGRESEWRIHSQEQYPKYTVEPSVKTLQPLLRRGTLAHCSQSSWRCGSELCQGWSYKQNISSSPSLSLFHTTLPPRCHCSSGQHIQNNLFVQGHSTRSEFTPSESKACVHHCTTLPPQRRKISLGRFICHKGLYLFK